MNFKLYLFFIISVIQYQWVYSQSKSFSYRDENFKEISKEHFENLATQKEYRWNQFENEQEVIQVLYQKQTLGNLSSQELEDLKKYLNQYKPLRNGLIMIVFYPGKDSCNDLGRKSTWNLLEENFQKEVSKTGIITQYWLYKSNENLHNYHRKHIEWTLDKDQFAERLFFKMHYPCASSVIIDQEGNFVANLGEFGAKDIYKAIEILKK